MIDRKRLFQSQSDISGAAEIAMGATLATMISIITQNNFASFYLFDISKIHPFRNNFI